MLGGCRRLQKRKLEVVGSLCHLQLRGGQADQKLKMRRVGWWIQAQTEGLMLLTMLMMLLLMCGGDVVVVWW